MHNLEKMKVLCPRLPLRFLREWRCKEWWYTGIHDPALGLYVSWYFIRVNVVDKFIMTVFDPALEDHQLPRVSRRVSLDGHLNDGPGLNLRQQRSGLNVHYRLEREGRWQFDLEADELEAEISIEQKIAPFTKFDNEIADNYALLHYFQSRANGVVRVPGGKSYELKNALVYQDHCYGRVPHRTGWNWLAVQSPDVALASLVNYGAYAQRYSQVWMNGDKRSPRPHQWVRLEQSVSFEREDRSTFKGRWRVTSTDLELKVQARQLVRDRTRIPSFVPAFLAPVDLAHVEAFVEANGKVRVDDRWIDTGPMYGVMEQHEGHW
jgi:hypothetical protein